MRALLRFQRWAPALCPEDSQTVQCVMSELDEFLRGKLHGRSARNVVGLQEACGEIAP